MLLFSFVGVKKNKKDKKETKTRSDQVISSEPVVANETNRQDIKSQPYTHGKLKTIQLIPALPMKLPRIPKISRQQKIRVDPGFG